MGLDPFPAGLQDDLEALKLRLVELRAEDVPEAQAAAIATEISAIRLQFKRLAADRELIDRAASTEQIEH